MRELERDKGGRILPGKRWRTFNFVVEVAVESPKNVEEEEAAEDAAEFAATLGRTMGRVHESFVSVTRIDEYGVKRPHDAPVFTQTYPSGEKVKLELPRGVLPKTEYAKVMKAKPKKARLKPAKQKAKAKKKKSGARF